MSTPIELRFSLQEKFSVQSGWNTLLDEIVENCLFIDYFGDLCFGRDVNMIYNKKVEINDKKLIWYSPNFILLSASQTIWSIKLCTLQAHDEASTSN